jgi:hypothetical protein
MRAQIHRRDPLSQAQVNVLFRVPALRMHEGLLALRPSLQVILRQWRTLIGTLALLADQHHSAVEPVLAQRLRRLRTNQTRANSRERLELPIDRFLSDTGL